MGEAGSDRLKFACAACGARTTTPEAWTRRLDALLCPECDAVVAPHLTETGRAVSRAESDWERLWRQIDEGLSGRTSAA